MTREAHEVALQAWAQNVLSAFDGRPELPPGHSVRVYYSDQGHARQPKPYATLLLLTDRATGSEDDASTEYLPGPDTIRLDFVSRRQGTARVQIFGDLHGEMSRALEHSLCQPPTREANRAAGLVVAFVSSPARRLSTDTDNVVEDRTVVDFAYRFSSVDSYETDEFIDATTLAPNYT